MFKPNHTHGGNILQIASRYHLNPKDMIDFSASINPLGVSPRAKRAITYQLDSVLHYPEQFAETLASEISGFHCINQECVLPGNGSTELIYLIPRVFRPGKALIVIPTFSEYRNALEINGCRIDTFMLSAENGFKLDLDLLADVLKKKYDILYICNPGNPTGALISKKDILEIADNALKFDTLCVIDEAFMDFAEQESVKKEAVERSNLIVLRSMTKFFGIPGMRVGFAVSSIDNIDRMKLNKEPWTINALGHVAAVESLKDTEYIEKTSIYVSEERNFLLSNLVDIQWVKPFPSITNYLLLRIERDDLDSDKLFDLLARNGIIIRSCSSFDGLGDRFFRIAIRTREENVRLLNGLRQIGKSG